MGAREEARVHRGERERAARGGVTMGALSLEICREHAGWSVHCFNAGFRWKTYRLASPSRKNSADTKLTRRRTAGVDGEYKSRLRVAITISASSSYSAFAEEVYMYVSRGIIISMQKCRKRRRRKTLRIDFNKKYRRTYAHDRFRF